MLAMHPDDPPMPSLRGTARLVHRPEHYQRMLDLVPSKHSGMEFCIGTLAEMPDSDIYQVVDRYSRSGPDRLYPFPQHSWQGPALRRDLC